mgnify:CR=1 FL=1
MNPPQQEKLNEYIRDMHIPRTEGTFRLGAIIVQEAERGEVKNFLREKGERVLVLDNAIEDVVLHEMVDAIEQERGVIIDVMEELSGRVYNQLSNLYHNRIEIQFDGEETRVIDPVPMGGFVILLLSDEQYRTMTSSFVLSSFCNLSL